MKKNYEMPVMELVEIVTEDILNTSLSLPVVPAEPQNENL